jgi:short-subunit dehydrogenase
MIRHVLITGGSKGIGYELAKQFAADGFSLILAARGEGALASAAAALKKRYGADILTIRCDLSRDGSPDFLYRTVTKRGIVLHTLVNNAGIALYGPLLETDGHDEMRMMHLNLLSPVRLTRLFLPDILSTRGGVLNVSSTAAFQPGPLMSVYYASKSFLLSFTESLAEEYSGKGITVSALCPGPTRSEFQEKSKIDNTRLIKSGLMRIMSTKEVASMGYRAYRSGRRVAVPGMLNRLGVMVVQNIPHVWSAKIVKKLNEMRA